MSEQMLSREQAAAFLGVKPQTLAVWASTHRYGLRFFKIGRLARYKQSDLERFIESRAVEPVAAGR